MKNIKINLIIAALSTLFLGSCNDDFLDEKVDLTGVNEQVYQDPILGKAYVDFVYGLFLPTSGSSSFIWDLSALGTTQFTQTTDEMAGETNWNKVWATINNTDANCLKYMGAKVSSSIANNSWTRLRQINLFIENIDKYGMEENARKQLKGQMLFWRAWQYYDLVKLYGGVPLILNSQSSISADIASIQTPRNSTSECIEQIVADLDLAKTLLPGKWGTGDWGRITSGAAAAMKGRVLLTWASPIFNPNDDVKRWQRAYDANLEARTILEANGSKLFDTGGTANGTAWGNMWFVEKDNPEAVIVYGFNNSVPSSGVSLAKNNGWEKACRSKELGGSGFSPTRQMVDAFPMKDGKKAGTSTTYPYTLQTFYKNRDPRFEKTFIYNGATWAYKEDLTFKQFTYSWKKLATDTDPNVFTETLGANSTGIYLRKGLNPNESSVGNFGYSGTDFMEMRFAEVVLNLAESAIGINKLTEGKAAIIEVRKRAGIDAGTDSQYGLTTATTRDQLFGAVIDERKVEFAYEGKRFWDLRRWMLFNDDNGTCTRLGQTPINGMRRQGYYFVAQKQANPTAASGLDYVHATIDPFKPNATTGIAPVFNRNPTVLPSGYANYAAYLDYFNTNYLRVVVRDNIEPNTAWKFTWYNQYYYFGINIDILATAPYLQQTVGWPGGTGVFDPLK